MSSRYSLLVSCEHASNAVPEHLDNLGLTDEELAGYHAWDEGAKPAAEALAEAFGAPIFLGEWSRLVADLNRPDDLPQVVPEVAFGLVVPGNQGLTEAERRERITTYHAPYWGRVLDQIRRLETADPEAKVVHLSVHSFTPELEGQVRAVSIGVMFDPAYPLEQALADKLVARIRQHGLVSAENQPYDGRAAALVTSCRNVLRAERYAGIEFEINQGHVNEIDRIGKVLIDAVRYAIEA